jgi:serine/threonine-protein kinase
MAKAAERLRLAQPSLSEQIRDLERELGATLFERTPRGMRLTTAGEQFLAHVRRTLRNADDAVEAVRRVHVTPSAANDLRERLQSAVGSAFVIERQIGGPSSRLFVAVEPALGRRVVVKALSGAMAASVSTERFRREVRLSAQLQHPHIVPALAAGSGQDLLYYTMPYVEGQSLRERLDREGQLPIGDAVSIACDVASALAYAHGRGIIHRDVTPDNILLTGDHALVTNFGIARAMALGEGAGRDTPLTAPGAMVGSAGYISPEQASGAGSVDARTDIYSLGCVLFEALAGELPFSAPTAQAIISAKQHEAAPLVRAHRATTPESVERAIATALAPLPADRFPSAEAFGRALRDPAGGRVDARSG